MTMTGSSGNRRPSRSSSNPEQKQDRGPLAERSNVPRRTAGGAGVTTRVSAGIFAGFNGRDGRCPHIGFPDLALQLEEQAFRAPPWVPALPGRCWTRHRVR